MIRKLLLTVISAIGSFIFSVTCLADIRDPQEQQFIVWPNIPFIKASDFHEYQMDRKIFEELHGGLEPSKILAALAAVDQIHGAHHPIRSLSELGRTLNKQLIGELDRLARRSNHPIPKLRFSFANISPSDLQRPIRLDAKALESLKTKASSVTLIIYITYTQLAREFTDLQLVATVVKLQTGESESFTVVGPIGNIGEILAKELYDFFYGNRFPPYKNLFIDKQWLLPAPGHRTMRVSREVAVRHCKLQDAALPTNEELEFGEASGLHHGGVSLLPRMLYHTATGLYFSSESNNVEGRFRPNYEPWASNGMYYCVRSKERIKAAAN